MSVKCGYKSIIGDYVFNKVELEVEKYRNQTGKKVISLGVGDVKIPPPNIVCENLIKQTEIFCTKEGFSGYPSELGILPLREKISEYYLSNGLQVFSDEIFITTGAKPCIGEILELCSFKRAVIIVPTYPLYEELCKAHGIQTVFINLNELNKMQNINFDLLFLCSPNNPTGEIIDATLFKQFITLANKKGATVILDGAYADFTKSYCNPYAFEGSERVVEVRTYSKNLCFTGLRCGYVVIKKKNPLNEGYKRYLSLRSNGVNVIIQKTAIAAYNPSVLAEVEKRVKSYRKRAEVIKSVLKKHNLKFSGGEHTPYVLCEVKTSGEDFFKDLLYSKGVVVTPGEAFKAKNSIRISCLASKEQIESGAKLLDEYLSNLK